jgi:hypothetical protein
VVEGSGFPVRTVLFSLFDFTFIADILVMLHSITDHSVIYRPFFCLDGFFYAPTDRWEWRDKHLSV